MSKPILHPRRAQPRMQAPHAVPASAASAAPGQIAPMFEALLFWRMAKTELGRSTLKVVWAVLLLQATLGAGAIWAGVLHLQEAGNSASGLLHLGAGLLLLVMTVLASVATRRLVREIQRSDNARAVAAGAFAPFVQQRFAEWGLTPAEHDVAMFTLKGFETHEIADLRETCQGTVRVQLAKVYEKAGVGSRCSFQSMFFEDLLDSGARADGEPDRAPLSRQKTAPQAGGRTAAGGSELLTA